jgi:hypothetical protein
MSHPGPASTTATDISAPIALRQLATAYQISQAVAVVARLGFAELLAGGPKAADELATVTVTHKPSLFRLLRALTAFGGLRRGRARPVCLDADRRLSACRCPELAS